MQVLAVAVKAGMKGATEPSLGLPVLHCMEKQSRKDFLKRTHLTELSSERGKHEDEPGIQAQGLILEWSRDSSRRQEATSIRQRFSVRGGGISPLSTYPEDIWQSLVTRFDYYD